MGKIWSLYTPWKTKVSLNIWIFEHLNILLNGEHLIVICSMKVRIPSLFEPSSDLGSLIEQREKWICCNIDHLARKRILQFSCNIAILIISQAEYSSFWEPPVLCCSDHMANSSSHFRGVQKNMPKLFSHFCFTWIFVNPTCFTSVPRGWFVSRRPLGDQAVLPIHQPLPLFENLSFLKAGQGKENALKCTIHVLLSACCF